MRRAEKILRIVMMTIGIAFACLLILGVFSWDLNTQRDAPWQTTKQSIRTVHSALSAYCLKTGTFPSTLQALTEGRTPYLDKIPNDSWNQPLVYELSGPSGTPYFLGSSGKDGELNTQDDIDVWTMDK